MAVSPRSQTRRAKFATFGVIPGVSLVTRTAGPLPRRNTSCRVPSQVKLVRWKSCRSSLVTRRDCRDRYSVSVGQRVPARWRTAVRAGFRRGREGATAVSYTHLRAHETDSYIVCRLLLEKKKQDRDRSRTK